MGSESATTAAAEPPASLDTHPGCDELFAELAARVSAYRPPEDLAALEAAYRFALERHAGQTRSSGEPYMTHPLHVALILAERKMDVVGLETALLHDILEDTGTTREELKARFGPAVAACVDGVTKLSKVHLKSAEERQAESLRKMLLAMVEDIRVILVKLADRLHNMRTLESLPADRREKVALETLEIYAPLAHRMGMGKIRAELQDLALKTLEPEEYEHVLHAIEIKRQASQKALAEIQERIQTELARETIPARVEGRVKRPYSVCTKMRRQKISIEQVYDLVGIRIITDSVKHCYAALGIIHNEWKPVPGRIKDFIALPRPNGYRSLHTSVIGPGGQPFEVQIRTEEMHRTAEEGIAAHWKYKEGARSASEEEQERMAWLRQVVEMQDDVSDAGAFMSSLKVDLYREEVYTFTPLGKVITLPRGATPVDFAYAIHTDVGHTCVGAKANGRIVPLRYELQNGDVVEILTQPNHQPSKDWLNFVKSARARSKIRHVINVSARIKAIEIGEKLFNKELRRLSLSAKKIDRQQLEAVAAEHGISKTEDLYAAFGYGKLSPRTILQKIAPEVAAPEPLPEPRPAPAPGAGADSTIYVRGMDDLLVYRAKCCNPIRGDEIVGYVTRGKGVAVHAKSCPNVQNLLYESDRRIDVGWERETSYTFPVHIMIYTDDRPGMLNQLTSVIANENCNIITAEARQDRGRGPESAIVELEVAVGDTRQLQRMMANLRRVSGVRDVERV